MTSLSVRPHRALGIALVLSLLAFPSISQTTGAWKLNEKVTPPAQSFELYFSGGTPSETGQDTGDTPFYHGRIRVAPVIDYPTETKLSIGLFTNEVKREDIVRRNPGGLALVSWSIDLSGIDYPYQALKQVRATFDRGGTVNSDGDANREFVIPAGATRLERFEVDFEWLSFKKTLTFAAVAPRRLRKRIS